MLSWPRLFRRSAPPAPVPAPLPEIRPPAPLGWPCLFPPTRLHVRRTHVLALHLSTEGELAALNINDAQQWARHCRYDGVALVLLTHDSNAGMWPLTDAARAQLLLRLSNPRDLDIDRWNSALLMLKRTDGVLSRTSLTGLGTRAVSRLMEEAELAFYLQVTRSLAPLDCDR